MRFATPMVKARLVNATDTSFPSKIPTVTEPIADPGTATGQAAIKIANNSSGVSNCHLRVVPYGTGDANDVFDMRIIGWNRVGWGTTPTGTLWVPTIICSLTCTIGAATGVANAPVVATELFVDTIVILSEPTITADTTRQGSVTVYSPASDLIGWADVELPPCEKIEFTFDMTTNDPTGANCLYQLYS